MILLLFLGKLLACLKYLSAVQEAIDETLLVAIFPAYQFGPRIHTLVYFGFISWEASLKYLLSIQEASDETLLLAIFSCFCRDRPISPYRDLLININISSYTPVVEQLYPGTTGTD